MYIPSKKPFNIYEFLDFFKPYLKAERIKNKIYTEVLYSRIF